MNQAISRWYVLLPCIFMLAGCDMQSGNMLVGLLVLVPLLLLIGILWWLNLFPRSKDNWTEQHFPDQENDDDEDHFLM